MSSPKAPPPPPPPPAAPPVLEQEAPKISDMNEEQSGLSSKSRGLKNYKIQKRNNMMSDNTKLGGVIQAPKS